MCFLCESDLIKVDKTEGNQDHSHCYFLCLNMNAFPEELQLNAKMEIRIMTLFSLRKLPSFLYETGNFEFNGIHFIISDDVCILDAIYSPKIVKLSLDVNFGLTS